MSEEKTEHVLLPCPFWNGRATSLDLAVAIENVISRRFRENKIDGYTKPMSEEIAALFSPVATDPLSDLVARFSAALLEKLRSADTKGRHGWAEDDWREACQRGLTNRVAKGDPRDVAAYCAFLWHHGWPTKPAGVNDLVLSIVRMSPAEQYDLTFKVAENIGYVLNKDSEIRRHQRLEDHDVLVARGEAEPF
jgi:hypothetical protein